MTVCAARQSGEVLKIPVGCIVLIEQPNVLLLLSFVTVRTYIFYHSASSFIWHLFRFANPGLAGKSIPHLKGGD